jgi:hypothetical protein
MSTSYQPSFRHVPIPTTTDGETVYCPDGVEPNIIMWPSVPRSRNQTIALIQGLAHDTTLANPVTLAKCRFDVDDKRPTANSLESNVEVAAGLYAKTGVPVSVCNDEVAFSAATSRIPSATLGFEVDSEWVRHYTRPSNHPTPGRSTSQYRGPTPDSLGNHDSNRDGYSPTSASVQNFPINASVPDIVINAFFNRRGTKGRKRAETAIPNAACQPELRGASGSSKFVEKLSASVKYLGHLYLREKPGKSRTPADKVVFRKEIGNTVAEVSCDSNVPITVCYTEADYAHVMKENPNLIVLKGKKRDALALHNLKQCFAGREGHESDPGCYSDDTDEDQETTDGGSQKRGRKMSG